MKKLLFRYFLSLLLLLSLWTWVLPRVHAGSYRFPNVTMRDEKGSFLVGNQTVKAYNSPDASGPVVAIYESGDQFLFDRVGINKYNFWLSYASQSGQRRYVPIPTPHDGAGFPAPPLGVMLGQEHDFGANARGHFYPNRVIKIRNSSQISASPISGPGPNYYESGDKVKFDGIFKADGHYWLTYISSSGTRRYLPIGEVNNQHLWGRLEVDY